MAPRDFMAEGWIIARWLLLKAAAGAFTAFNRDRAQSRIIRLGNRLFPRQHADDIFTDFASYVANYPADLRSFDDLLPKEGWLVSKSVLDVGSGLGQYSAALLRTGAREVVSLEIQEQKAAWSQEHFRADGVRAVVGSATALPFADQTFDSAFSQTVFEHIDDVETAFREVRRVLRPGGVFVLSYNYLHHRGGHHLFPYIHFPWATWVAREDAVCRHWSDRLAKDQAQGKAGFYPPGCRVASLSEGNEIHLNRLNFDQVEQAIAAAGWRIERRRSSEALPQAFPWLGRVPVLKYFLMGTIYYVLRA